MSIFTVFEDMYGPRDSPHFKYLITWHIKWKILRSNHSGNSLISYAGLVHSDPFNYFRISGYQQENDYLL